MLDLVWLEYLKPLQTRNLEILLLRTLHVMKFWRVISSTQQSFRWRCKAVIASVQDLHPLPARIRPCLLGFARCFRGHRTKDRSGSEPCCKLHRRGMTNLQSS
ncbi:uncharacterized protein PHALS_00957 [Plasmopara halstedii]|uniref:Uncharacterized protein n=1 Tax=Plasmopara halstedii TaxID=4781 RepID=A0A0P1ATR8_PLAHL|nr:uncharacterized protein PHALS_00957 [Plasmopara halstedii]CEG44610.1 hypothetical protein PHALS_00957 [Plasmopara halstedii]|eukprot:XP_024580979.1 hypothetical protein PHALS_00957 [Plasmopara halstedii]